MMHPMLRNEKRNDKSLKNKFIYKGPNLVIENVFFEKPELLIARCKKEYQAKKRDNNQNEINLINQKYNNHYVNTGTMFTMYKSQDYRSVDR